MALLQAQLAADIRSAMRQKPPTARAAASAYADAYQAYANAAQTVVGGLLPIFTGLEASLLANTLYAAFAEPRAGSPSQAASAWASAVTAFWVSPPVVFGTGLVSPPPTGGAALQAGLSALFAGLYPSEAAVADPMAALLHAFTTAVLVTIPGAPPVLTTLI